METSPPGIPGLCHVVPPYMLHKEALQNPSATLLSSLCDRALRSKGGGEALLGEKKLNICP